MARARGTVRGDGGGAALVAQVVEIDFVGAGGFGHFGEVEASGLARSMQGDEAVAPQFDFGPGELGCDGDDHVQAFAAGGFEEGFELQLFEAAARTSCGGCGEGGPGERFVGVEIDDEPVGVLEAVWMLRAVGERAPGMDFENGHLCE